MNTWFFPSLLSIAAIPDSVVLAERCREPVTTVTAPRVLASYLTYSVMTLSADLKERVVTLYSSGGASM